MAILDRTAPEPAIQPITRLDRLDSVDLVRGWVMVVMALDHVRAFFSASRINPEDLNVTTPALFLTRWVTCFCAPTFVFLAGVGASLSLIRGEAHDRGSLARFLLTRGIWLVFLEFTLVKLGMFFNLDYHFLLGEVIWAIGCSMIGLAGLVAIGLGPRAIGAVGVVVVAGSDLIGTIPGTRFGSFGPVWDVLLHRQPFVPMPGYLFFSAYPPLPWFGIMALGFGFAVLLAGDGGRGARRLRLIVTGLAMLAGFVVLRWSGVYGDPNPWSTQGGWVRQILSFVHTSKYPPSLQFVLMTVGLAVLALGVFDRPAGPIVRPIVTFGRVPLFYFLIHMPWIHALAMVAALVQCGHAEWLWANPPASEPPPEFGFGLPGVYLVWISVVVSLYWPCRWFAGVKRRRGGILRFF